MSTNSRFGHRGYFPGDNVIVSDGTFAGMIDEAISREQARAMGTEAGAGWPPAHLADQVIFVVLTIRGRPVWVCLEKNQVRDNGRGMNWEDLHNFFVMHGENEDRRRGRGGRGRFGTGKSAAFGIAETLRITTVKAGQRTCVELNRSDINAMATGDEIPVRVLDRAAATTDPNGTLIEIEDIGGEWFGDASQNLRGAMLERGNESINLLCLSREFADN